MIITQMQTDILTPDGEDLRDQLCLTSFLLSLGTEVAAAEREQLPNTCISFFTYSFFSCATLKSNCPRQLGRAVLGTGRSYGGRSYGGRWLQQRLLTELVNGSYFYKFNFLSFRFFSFLVLFF